VAAARVHAKPTCTRSTRWRPEHDSLHIVHFLHVHGLCTRGPSGHHDGQGSTPDDTARAEVAERLADVLAARSTEVVDRLGQVVSGGNDRDAVGAARVLLAEGRAWRECGYVEQRLTALEVAKRARQAERGSGRWVS